MKKLLLNLLSIALCILLCACGSNETNSNSSKQTVSTKSTKSESNISSETISEDEVLDIEDIAGTWKTDIWFFDSTLQINANTTYTYGREKGTVSIYDDRFTLTDSSGMYKTPFGVYGDYIYDRDHDFDKDLDYGLAFSPDANGRTDQTFNYAIINVSSIDTSYNANCVQLDLNSDGTFIITTGTRTYSSFTKKEEFNGTYTYNNSILFLDYNGKDYPLIVKDGIIYFHVFKK